jgi:serine/threonine protein kinase
MSTSVSSQISESQILAAQRLREEQSLIQSEICEWTSCEIPAEVISKILSHLKAFHIFRGTSQESLQRRDIENLTIIHYGRRAYLKYAPPSAEGASKTGGYVLDLLNLKSIKYGYNGKFENCLELEICMRKDIQAACEEAGIPNTICEVPLADNELIVKPYTGDGMDFTKDISGDMFLPDFLTAILHHLIEINKINLIHADIKPENFLYDIIDGKTPRLETQLIDFENSFFDDEEDQKALLKGSPLYMPPELLTLWKSGDRENIIKHNSSSRDVWSLGVTLASLCAATDSSLLPSSFREKILQLHAINADFEDSKEENRKNIIEKNMPDRIEALTSDMIAKLRSQIDSCWIELTDCIMNLRGQNEPPLTKEELLTKEHDFSCLLYYMLQRDPSKRITPAEIQQVLEKETVRFCC